VEVKLYEHEGELYVLAKSGGPLGRHYCVRQALLIDEAIFVVKDWLSGDKDIYVQSSTSTGQHVSATGCKPSPRPLDAPGVTTGTKLLRTDRLLRGGRGQELAARAGFA